MKTNRVEIHRIKKNNPFFSIIDELCWKSKNLYNYGNYIVRQEFINTSKEKEQGLRENAHWIRHYDLCKMLKTSDPYKDMGSNVGQATLKKLDQAWKAFFQSIKDYSKHPEKYLGRPKMPGYLPKETGRYECDLTNDKFRIINGFLYFSWTPLKCMNHTFRTAIPEGTKLMQCRFIPKAEEYEMEIVYQIDVPDIENTSVRIASIDLGIDNLMTITTNCGINPIVINGKPLKSMNQYYNKQMSKMRSELKKKNNAEWSKEMQRFTTKRNHKVDDYIHKATKMVIDFCKENNIDTLVCGYNSGWKQESNMGKRENQKFISIPYQNILLRLQYKCETAGIRFLTTQEDYTSGTSFLDGEEPIQENYNKKRRKHRGLFISNNGTCINADVNGSYQILKKEYPNAFPCDITTFGLHPIIHNIAS